MLHLHDRRNIRKFSIAAALGREKLSKDFIKDLVPAYKYMLRLMLFMYYST